jgi:hypothetical protein
MSGSSDICSEQINPSVQVDLDQSGGGLKSTPKGIVGSRDEAQAAWEKLLASIKDHDAEQVEQESDQINDG